MNRPVQCATRWIAATLAGLATSAAATTGPAGPPPPFVNQLGYDRDEAKRFTLPGVADGTPFTIRRLSDGVVVFSGTVRRERGDFTAFNPASDVGDYVVAVTGRPSSDPFRVRANLFATTSSRLGYQFFIDVRGGFTPDLSPANATGGGPSRDGGGATLETVFMGLLYASNPSLFDRWNNELRYEVREHDEPMYAMVPPGEGPPALPTTEAERKAADRLAIPDILKLTHWYAQWAYRHRHFVGPTGGFEGKGGLEETTRYFGRDDAHKQAFDRQNLLDHLAGWHAFYRPFLSRWFPAEEHRAMRAALLAEWDAAERAGELRYWTHSLKWIDQGRLEFNEMGSALGQGLLRNLLMYIGERAEPDGGQADRFAKYVRDCASDLVKNWSVDKPEHSWRLRNAEHIAPQALAMLMLMAPELAPPGTRAKLAEWRDQTMRRSDNLWEYRTHDATEWAHPRSKEVGTVAGMGGAMFAVAAVLDDPALRARGWSQVNFVFGANPAGAHLSNKSAARVALDGYWPGIERGWPHYFLYGIGQLGMARGTLDGSPMNHAFPYHPERAAEGDTPATYGTEGWVLTNRAWAATIAFSTLGAQRVRFVDPDGNTSTSLGAGRTVAIELKAALDAKPDMVERGEVDLTNGNARRRIVVTETGTDTGIFRSEPMTLPRGRWQASYGYLTFRTAARITAR